MACLCVDNQSATGSGTEVLWHRSTLAQKYFALHQEALQKDIERAFGVLQKRFAIVRNPCRQWYRTGLHNVIRTCLILHNMIIEDEAGDALECLDWVGPDVVVAAPQRPSSNWQERFPQFLATHKTMRNTQAHLLLQKSLVDRVWGQRVAYMAARGRAP